VTYLVGIQVGINPQPGRLADWLVAGLLQAKKSIMSKEMVVSLRKEITLRGTQTKPTNIPLNLLLNMLREVKVQAGCPLRNPNA